MKANLRKDATGQHDAWWHSHKNLAVLATGLIGDSHNLDQARRAVREALDQPWNWYAEFVVARCRELDGGR